MKHTAKKLIALLLAGSMLLLSPQLSVRANADYESTLKELNNRIEQLDKEQKKLEADIAKAKTEKDKKLAEKRQLDSEVKIAKEQIALLTERIALLSQNIEEKEAEIINAQGNIDVNYDLFKKRLRAMYMTNNASQIGLILGAESFSEFLSKSEMLTSIAEHDKELLNNLIENKRNIEDAKAQIEASKAEVDASKVEMEAKKKQLDGMVQTTNAKIQDIDQLAAEYAKNKAVLDKQEKEVQAEIQKIYDEMNSEGDYTGGVLAWPVPGFSRISSDFGWRFNKTDYHTGIDIAGTSDKGIMGQKIVAAADGKVAFVNRSFVPGRGYGIYVIIDHGGGVSTLYGHTSKVLVEYGQTVKRGQEIAKVGSTGWSTGPHLHFEVRETVNGKKGQYVNPWKYLK